MPRHNFLPLSGTVVTIEIESAALRDNLLGDPAARTVAVYLPPGARRGPAAAGAGYPLFVFLAGYTGSGLKQLSWQAFGESVPQRLERLVAEGRMGPAVAAFPDAFTSLGGNQYVNSVATGRWEDFVIDDLLPRIEAEFPVKRGASHRAVLGKSSGGYGALVHALRHGDAWGAVAAHSPDIEFDWVYRGELPKTLDVLARSGGDVSEFLRALEAAPKIGDAEMHALMILAMAASYDPDPSAPRGIRLPVDPQTAQLDPERWQAWLAHDPLRLVERSECQASLRRLRGLYLDCGRRDQYFLHYGCRALVRRLGALGIPHRYDEFDDNHSGIDYRMDVSLPYLYEVIT